MTPEQKRAELEAAGLVVTMPNGAPSISLKTGEPVVGDMHCMCLGFTSRTDDTVYEACCKCWWEKGEAFSVVPRKRRRRDPR